MKNKLHTTSVKAWDSMLRAINQAKKSIYLEMYILSDDTRHSHNFIEKLKEKARKNIRIIIVADSYGSSSLTEDTIKKIRDTGAEFLFFSHWLRHIHRKILIVDEEVAFIGGVNIGKAFIKWNDLQLELHGKIVKKIISSFAYTYEIAGGKNAQILAHRRNRIPGKRKSWLLEHSPSKNIHTLKSHYIKKINNAKKTIQIITPYLIPPRWLISLLDNAIKRNVQVEIFVPLKSDMPFVNGMNYRFMQKLHYLGIKFFLLKTMNHSKLLLIDSTEALIGSQNLDFISFNINFEAGVFMRDQKIIQELKAVINKWKEQSREFKPRKYKRHLSDYFFALIHRLLHPIL